MAHIIGFYMYHPYGIQKKRRLFIGGLKSAATKSAIPTEFGTQNMGNGQGLKPADVLLQSVQHTPSVFWSFKRLTSAGFEPNVVNLTILTPLT
jgi:hypothetical protein